MSCLLDTNVILRVLLDDREHNGFVYAIQSLTVGGTIRSYVMPEVIYGFFGELRKRFAQDYANDNGELKEFNAAPKLYSKKIRMPAGWVKSTYNSFEVAMIAFLKQYPSVGIDEYPLFKKALSIACATGYDWVDCLLFAEKRVNGCEVLSLDSDVTNPKDERSPKSKSSLGGLHLK